jgi:hypothetical protein
MSNDIASLLKAAQNESTGSKELLEIWKTTTSTRVRKAVASNPNCSTATMAIAARLYIKEVVNNPSFEVLKVFNDDKIVEQIYDAYKDPQKFSTQNSIYSIKDKIIVNSIAKAMLISPYFDNYHTFSNFIFTALSNAEISRELKDPEVMGNLQKVINKEIYSRSNRISLVHLKYFFDSKVISMEGFRDGLYSLTHRQNFSSKKSFCFYVDKILCSGDYECLFKYFHSHSNGSLDHLNKEVKDGKFTITDEIFDTLVSVYKDSIYGKVFSDRFTYVNNKSPYNMSYNFDYKDSDHACYFSDLIWNHVNSKFNTKTCPIEDINFNSIYYYLEKVGLEKDFGPYKCGLEFNKTHVYTIKTIICQKLMEIKDDKIFEFFMSCGVLWEEWYAKTSKDNIESEIVDRMHKINVIRNNRYYRCSDLSVFPTISINVYNGLDYNRNTYYPQDLLTRNRVNINSIPMPPTSGKLSNDGIIKIVSG